MLARIPGETVGDQEKEGYRESASMCQEMACEEEIQGTQGEIVLEVDIVELYWNNC